MVIFVVLMATLLSVAQAGCERADSQAEMNACAVLQANAAQHEMDLEWIRSSSVMKRLDRTPEVGHDSRGTYFSALLNAQRAWLKFRDAQCRIEGFGSRGGSIEPMVESQCYNRLTRKRTQWLREYRRSFGE